MVRTTTSPVLSPTRMHSPRPWVWRTSSVCAHGDLHGQGGIAGAQGVVFVGNGGAKEDHNAVAEHLVHRALEAVHGVHHAVEGRVQQPLGGSRIEAADELRCVLDIGEEHGDLFAPAF